MPTGGGAGVSLPYLSQAEIDAMLPRAAAGDLSAAIQLTAYGVRLNGHQWNYYRERAGNPPAPGTEGLDQLMTATEYIAYRAALGLSGLGRVYRYGGVA